MHTRPQNIYTVAQALKSDGPPLVQQEQNNKGVDATTSEETSGGAITWLLGTCAATGVFVGFVVASQYFLDAKTTNADNNNNNNNNNNNQTGLVSDTVNE